MVILELIVRIHMSLDSSIEVHCTMKFANTIKVLAKRMPKYYKTPQCTGLIQLADGPNHILVTWKHLSIQIGTKFRPTHSKKIRSVGRCWL